MHWENAKLEQTAEDLRKRLQEEERDGVVRQQEAPCNVAWWACSVCLMFHDISCFFSSIWLGKPHFRWISVEGALDCLDWPAARPTRCSRQQRWWSKTPSKWSASSWQWMKVCCMRQLGWSGSWTRQWTWLKLQHSVSYAVMLSHPRPSFPVGMFACAHPVGMSSHGAVAANAPSAAERYSFHFPFGFSPYAARSGWGGGGSPPSCLGVETLSFVTIQWTSSLIQGPLADAPGRAAVSFVSIYQLLAL